MKYEDLKVEKIIIKDSKFWEKILEDAKNKPPIKVEEQNKKLIDLFRQIRN